MSEDFRIPAGLIRAATNGIEIKKIEHLLIILDFKLSIMVLHVEQLLAGIYVHSIYYKVQNLFLN